MALSLSKVDARASYQESGCCLSTFNHDPCAIVHVTNGPSSGFTCKQLSNLYCGSPYDDIIVWDGCETCYGVFTIGHCVPSPSPSPPVSPPPPSPPLPSPPPPSPSPPPPFPSPPLPPMPPLIPPSSPPFATPSGAVTLTYDSFWNSGDGDIAIGPDSGNFTCGNFTCGNFTLRNLYDVHLWDATTQIWRHYYKVSYSGLWPSRGSLFVGNALLHQNNYDTTQYSLENPGDVTYVEVSDQLTSTYIIPITYFDNSGTYSNPKTFMFLTPSLHQVQLVTERFYNFQITIDNATGRESGIFPDFQIETNPQTFNSTVTASSTKAWGDPGQILNQRFNSNNYGLPFALDTPVPSVSVVCADECSGGYFSYYGDTAEHVIGFITVTQAP